MVMRLPSPVLIKEGIFEIFRMVIYYLSSVTPKFRFSSFMFIMGFANALQEITE
jgi:hypothetical protein